jgi:hypothetical protein
MEAKQPVGWKIALIIDLGMLGGFIIAALTVPPTTRLALFLSICLAAFVAGNTYFYFNGYRRQQPKSSADPAEAKEPKDVRFWRMVLTVVAWAIILWQVAHRYWLK